MCMGQRSSTIIKGFKIPKNSYEVWISYFEGNYFITESYSTNEMIEIPVPHGRLIDASKVFTYDYLSEQDLNSVPTILESEN